MNTRIVKPTDAEWRQVVEALKSGDAVGMPTETVYGLAANALDGEAAQKIYTIKNRPADNPLICHISSMEMLKMLASSVPDHLLPIMKEFWPGPLTLLLPKAPGIPDVVTGGLDTVAVRMPSNSVALQLIEEAGFPLAAPSANLSGRPSPTCSAHVLCDLQGRIEWIVEGGSSEYGLESTVLDALRSPPLILRPGAITKAMLARFLPNVRHFTQQQMAEMLERPPTPGLKYRHYSPTAPVALFNRSQDIPAWLPSDKRVVWIHTRLSDIPDTPNLIHIHLSRDGCLRSIAHNLFGALREADSHQPDWIVAEVVDDGGDDEGLAIMNRLSKAATLRL